MRWFFLLILSFLLASCANNQMKKQMDTIHGVGDVYAKSGRLADAEMYYARAHALAPEQPILLNKLANTQLQQGKLKEAKASYQQLLKQNPNSKQARLRLASVALSLGDTHLALTQYRTLLKNNKRDPKALNGLGVLLDNMHKNRYAQACYRRGLAFAPDNYSLLNNMGLSYALSGNFKEARHYLGKSKSNTKIERPKNNYTLIIDHYKKFKNPTTRQAQLKKDLLLKNLKTNPKLASEAITLALQTC